MTPPDWRNAAAGSASWAANRSMAARVRPEPDAPHHGADEGHGEGLQGEPDTDAKASPSPPTA